MVETIARNSSEPVGRDPEDLSLLIKGVADRFDDVDINRSGSLDRNELEMTAREGASAYLREAAAMLLTNYDQASQFSSTNNHHKFHEAATEKFEDIFGSDKTADGVSMSDLHAIELVASDAEGKAFLTELREVEKGHATAMALFSGGLVATGLIMGIAPTGVSQVASIASLAGSVYPAFLAVRSFAFSDVPKFEDYMRDRRKSMATW